MGLGTFFWRVLGVGELLEFMPTFLVMSRKYQPAPDYLGDTGSYNFLLKYDGKADQFSAREVMVVGRGFQDFWWWKIQFHAISEESTQNFNPVVQSHLKGLSCSYYIISVVRAEPFLLEGIRVTLG